MISNIMVETTVSIFRVDVTFTWHHNPDDNNPKGNTCLRNGNKIKYVINVTYLLG
jgi:hypothetical protein